MRPELIMKRDIFNLSSNQKQGEEKTHRMRYLLYIAIKSTVAAYIARCVHCTLYIVQSSIVLPGT